MNAETKNALKQEVARCLGQFAEVRRVIVFGSFLNGESPNDMDVAVFQDSDEAYLPLALKYRRMTKSVSATIPLDIIPLRPGASGSFMEEIARGEVVYER